MPGQVRREVSPSTALPSVTLDSLTHTHAQLLAWDAFVLYQIGVWSWEYIHTCRLDWRLVLRRDKLRPSGVCFLLARASLTSLFVGELLLVQNLVPINCQGVWIVLVIAGSLAVSCSNAIYCLRALAVWSNRLAVLVPIVGLWLTQVCIWCLDIVSLNTRGQQLPVLGYSCASFSAAKYSAIPFLTTILVDVTASSFIIAGLWKQSKEPGAPTLRKLLLRDAAIYSAISLGPNVIAPILFWVTKHLILRTLMVSFAVLVHVVMSSRAFITLHDAGPLFPGWTRTEMRNGELLDRDSLDRFASFRASAWFGMGGAGCGTGPVVPPNLDAQRQVSELYRHFRYPEQLASDKHSNSLPASPSRVTESLQPATPPGSDAATLTGIDYVPSIRGSFNDDSQTPSAPVASLANNVNLRIKRAATVDVLHDNPGATEMRQVAVSPRSWHANLRPPHLPVDVVVEPSFPCSKASKQARATALIPDEGGSQISRRQLLARRTTPRDALLPTHKKKLATPSLANLRTASSDAFRATSIAEDIPSIVPALVENHLHTHRCRQRVCPRRISSNASTCLAYLPASFSHHGPQQTMILPAGIHHGHYSPSSQGAELECIQAQYLASDHCDLPRRVSSPAESLAVSPPTPTLYPDGNGSETTSLTNGMASDASCDDGHEAVPDFARPVTGTKVPSQRVITPRTCRFHPRPDQVNLRPRLSRRATDPDMRPSQNGRHGHTG